MQKKNITRKAATSHQPLFVPPVNPKNGDKKFNQRAWNAERNAEHNWIFAVDLNCIQTKRPATHWQVMKRAMRHLAQYSHVLERFPDLDVCSPQAIYYINYCIQTSGCKCRSGCKCDHLKAVFSREIAKRVFHSCLIEESIERVEKTRAVYMEMYGFVQGRRTMFNRTLEEKPAAAQEESSQVIDMRQKRLESLREELAYRQKYRELEDEGLIFRLKQQIHELEYEIDTDEWPEVIGDE
jgi:anti-sigma28 factor (negative regulator of flagellin synthesis)